MVNEEDTAPSADEQSRAEFYAEMDALIELNSRDWSVPETGADEAGEPAMIGGRDNERDVAA